jgi:hypothetical protein
MDEDNERVNISLGEWNDWTGKVFHKLGIEKRDLEERIIPKPPVGSTFFHWNDFFGMLL